MPLPLLLVRCEELARQRYAHEWRPQQLLCELEVALDQAREVWPCTSLANGFLPCYTPRGGTAGLLLMGFSAEISRLTVLTSCDGRRIPRGNDYVVVLKQP